MLSVLSDKNGFHIQILHQEIHKYIKRKKGLIFILYAVKVAKVQPNISPFNLRNLFPIN